MTLVGSWIARVVAAPHDAAGLAAIREEVLALCRRFPIYGA